MAKILKIKKREHKPRLYDVDTGKTCQTERVVDITEDCPKANEENRAILLFTRAKAGRLVQITRPSPGKVYMGSQITFLVEGFDSEVRTPAWDDTFGPTAGELGLTSHQLLKIIKEHVPA